MYKSYHASLDHPFLLHSPPVPSFYLLCLAVRLLFHLLLHLSSSENKWDKTSTFSGYCLSHTPGLVIQRSSGKICTHTGWDTLSHFSTYIPTYTHPFIHIHRLTHNLQLGWCNKHIDKTISVISSVCQNVIPQPHSHYHGFSIYSGSLNKRPRPSWPTVIPISTPTHTEA